MTFYPAFAFLLFPAMILLLELGRWQRRRRESEGNSTIEGAIFALFGLLLTEEVNDIGTAFLRLDLLPPQMQPELRQLFRDYTNSRLHLFEGAGQEISPETAQLQRAIWQRATAASSSPGANSDATKLLLPAINDMIDITSTRQNAFYMHPPAVVYWLLFIFSGGSALMAGYSMKPGPHDWVHSVALAVAVTLTVYTILDVEYPQRGLIRLSDRDRTLISLRDSMK
jgi:hypothetical protein